MGEYTVGCTAVQDPFGKEPFMVCIVQQFHVHCCSFFYDTHANAYAGTLLLPLHARLRLHQMASPTHTWVEYIAVRAALDHLRRFPWSGKGVRDMHMADVLGLAYSAESGEIGLSFVRNESRLLLRVLHLYTTQVTNLRDQQVEHRFLRIGPYGHLDVCLEIVRTKRPNLLRYFLVAQTHSVDELPRDVSTPFDVGRSATRCRDPNAL
ncbi:unnamed protein product [Ectocarpus sp. 12 AP-2014]